MPSALAARWPGCLVDFLMAGCSAVAGVRIETGHRDYRRLGGVFSASKASLMTSSTLSCVILPLTFCKGTWFVTNNRRMLLETSIIAHRLTPHASPDFWSGRRNESGQMHGLFVQRGRGCGMNGPFEREAACTFHVRDGRLAAMGVELAAATVCPRSTAMSSRSRLLSSNRASATFWMVECADLHRSAIRLLPSSLHRRSPAAGRPPGDAAPQRSWRRSRARSRRITQGDADNRSLLIHLGSLSFHEYPQIAKTIFTGTLRRVSSSTAA